MDAKDWDERYATADLVWSAEPNRFVEEIVAPLTAGTAIDIAAGEGRNAIWLAQQGWTVTATDYSSVAVERMRARADALLGAEAGRLTPLVADATVPAPGGPAAYDLALFCYLQLPASELRVALRHGVEAVRPGGRVLVVGHAGRNLAEGWGGPSSRDVLYDPDEVVDAVDGLPVVVEHAGIRVRPVETEEGPREALDTVVVLRRD
ncbi:class I SAM-dependent methyltransferase [Intrasporangium calvum]|uniref:Methyltransferase type 12 n=1 Tax=Intrasporangium calvum (strain ATCC 23552 / DSM 43043 / JCM 3097 / NBRC 12989 / NCIMB 10167 / NRRL B-3866 / 7 KIP) TaxID=710696 RepID=E6SFZ6_INTC7|nr:class I SAM-dependent methyltransferase [Intrasporangium calvum]ADU49950.1 Methyltransferase type 12 [Intrasporangium calvum DSM 43043]AXG14787.1 class I SAM-dependent methyltransferase [Intrasporangium calvum]